VHDRRLFLLAGTFQFKPALSASGASVPDTIRVKGNLARCTAAGAGPAVTILSGSVKGTLTAQSNDCSDFSQLLNASGTLTFVPSEIAWKPGPDSLPPGAKMAVLEGEPTKEGFFTLRLLMPDGYRFAPHGIRRSSD
jgi:hypothetical protein